MALVLVRLKLTIQRRTFGRGGTTQRVLYLAGWTLGLVLGLAVGAAVASFDAHDGGGELALVGLTTVLFAGWVLLPLMIPVAGDQTVDPAYLEQYPLTARQQVTGLLAAGMISPTALFTFLAVAGGTFATGEPAGGRLTVVVAAALFTVLCVAASRTLLALVAQGLRSRRGRDLVIAGTGVLTVAVYLMTQTAHDLTSEYAQLENGPLEAVLSWLPPGSVGAALLAAHSGDWVAVSAHLIVPVVAVIVLMTVWGWAIRRRVRVAGHGSASGTRRKHADLTLFPLPFQVLVPSPMSASAAQQFRYVFFRSAKAAQGFLLPVVIAAIAAHASIEDNGLVLSATVFIGIALLSSVFNVFGNDGPGVAYLAIGAPPWRSVLAGKLIAPVPAIGLAVGLFVIVESIVLGRWDQSAAAFLTALGLMAAGLGVGALTSVHFPTDVAGPGGSRQRALIGVGAGLGLLLVVALAGGALWAALRDPIGDVGFGVVAILLGGLVGYGFYRLAARSLVNDPGRLVEAFDA
ncbi:hypothetical protein [Ilumatobacter sp.]|uniref:hypothetical protein n=1 Tax=Ilumatobacter sp. TaxID=1967498 RepID=UPI003AF7825F